MKDFITGADIDIQSLFKVVKSVEKRPHQKFDMGTWCGTACCAMGSFCESYPNDELKMYGYPVLFPYGEDEDFAVYDQWAISWRFKITRAEAEFLFQGNRPGNSNSMHAADLSKRGFLRRIRKYLYYKMRKSELLEDYDAARRMGDVGVVDKVLEEVG